MAVGGIAVGFGLEAGLSGTGVLVGIGKYILEVEEAVGVRVGVIGVEEAVGVRVGGLVEVSVAFTLDGNFVEVRVGFVIDSKVGVLVESPPPKNPGR